MNADGRIGRSGVKNQDKRLRGDDEPVSRGDFWDRVGPETEWVLRQLRRLRVPESDLDDATQEVLITVHGKWSQFDPSRSLRSWLFGFAFRIAALYRRRSRARNAEPEVDDLASPIAGPDARLEASQAREIVLRALDALDDDRRAVLVLVDLEGFAVTEAALALEIPLNTAYSRLRVARARFAEEARSLTRPRRER